jgi:hypothetical protein
MTIAERIAQLADETAPATAVVFNGSDGPRKIGELAAAPSVATDAQAHVDAMLMAANLSARFISRATTFGRLVVIAHG